MLNQSLYYTIQYFEANTKSRAVVTTTPLVADVAKMFGSLKVNCEIESFAFFFICIKLSEWLV